MTTAIIIFDNNTALIIKMILKMIMITTSIIIKENSLKKKPDSFALTHNDLTWETSRAANSTKIITVGWPSSHHPAHTKRLCK